MNVIIEIREIYVNKEYSFLLTTINNAYDGIILNINNK
jgi:hypothetical protein